MKKFLEREKDKITIEYLVNVNRNLEDNLIVNLKNEIYELKKELSQLEQENENLRKTIKNDDRTINKLANDNRLIRQEKEEFMKWLEEKKMYRKKQILYMEGTEIDCLNDTLLLEYDEILSKLKESDK